MRSLIAFLLATPLLIGGCDRQSPQATQANEAVAQTAPPSLDDAMADANDAMPADAAPAAAPQGKVDRSHKGQAMPAVAFQAPDGKAVSLADFKGKPLLVNLWATWCAPCVAEMPTLDALAARSDGPRVVAVSQDLDGAAKVTPFFKAHDFTALKPYLDSKLALSTAYNASLPTTILYDAQGREVWRVSGGFDWTGAEATRLLAEARCIRNG